MKLRAKGKIRRDKLAAEKEFEEQAEIKVLKVDEPVVAYRGEARTGEIVQIWADEIEAIYQELGLKLNRASAEDKALNIVRHMRIHAHVKFSDVA